MTILAQTRMAINGFYRKDEEAVVDDLLKNFPITAEIEKTIQHNAAQWIQKLRNQPSQRTLLEDFMQRYSLSTAEGIALMSIAEAFLRVPDTEMADKLIIDKITNADWDHVALEGEKFLTMFSGWGLRLSETLLKEKTGVLGKMTQRLGLPVIRKAVVQAIKVLGSQFVCGRTIEEALKNAHREKQLHEAFSYDMLGEGARMQETATHYFNSYIHAIETTGRHRNSNDLYKGDGISIKLSALHPRYEEFQRNVCLPVLIDRVRQLALLGKKYNMLITLDAEEAERLEISLDIFAAVFSSPGLVDYHGLGLAVQAYQKRASAVMDYLIALARQHQKTIPVRLVKGAYWDSEIKRAQERGLSGYPVFTRKVSTDISYLAVAGKMLTASDAIYPAFATHNAFTIAAIVEMAQRNNCSHYEFQRLHGMGQQLYAAAYEALGAKMPLCRVYAPVGVHQDLLPYLVRRLLENGANSSFVHQVYEKNVDIEKLVENPARKIMTYKTKAHSEIPLPGALYADRRNSVAPDLSDRHEREVILQSLPQYKNSAPVLKLEVAAVDGVMRNVQQGFTVWHKTAVTERADIVDRIADLYEKRRDELLALCVYEAKKTIPDAIAEWREAIDFCRYYAAQARRQLARPETMPGPTGETNQLFLEGRGVFVCVSPWNFPLAIFTGQVVAALVAGNAVIAKPAEQTPAIAKRAIELMHLAGVPQNVVMLVAGSGSTVGAACIAHPLCAGVAFTGSTETAWRIQKSLADKRGPIVPFIAETGGQNAMIVDSTALAEQVVDDAIRSAFHSAGQRCSALRVLFLQEEIASSVIKMLSGAMQELGTGDPSLLSTDVGPVIDQSAAAELIKHVHALQGQQIAQSPMTTYDDSCVTPTLFHIYSINDLDKENFGPLLHIVTYKADRLDEVIQSINTIGYGLTLGIHSRVESRVQYIIDQARVGNIYVNRGMTGAVVGVQPFGGMGLSGTGPKAGGPHYLQRFVTEKTVSVNTTASGGNTTLATLSEPMAL